MFVSSKAMSACAAHDPGSQRRGFPRSDPENAAPGFLVCGSFVLGVFTESSGKGIQTPRRLALRRIHPSRTAIMSLRGSGPLLLPTRRAHGLRRVFGPLLLR